MRRRDFIKGGIGALATTGCSGVSHLIIPGGPNISPEEMQTFLEGLDGAMIRAASDPQGGQHIGDLDRCPLSENEATLFRQAMRSMLLVGNFGDLPLQGQTHPGIQERLKYSAPEMNKALTGLMERTRALNSSDYAYIKKTMQDDPGRASRVLQAIELEAANVAVPHRRRMQLRVMGNKIISRLNHSPEMVVNEYLAKSDRILSKEDSITYTRYLLKSRLGEEGFDKRIKDIENAAQYWDRMEISRSNIDYELLRQDKTEKDEDEDSCQSTLDALGIGALITLGGWLLIGLASLADVEFLGWIGVVAGITVGPITILICLILLLFC